MNSTTCSSSSYTRNTKGLLNSSVSAVSQKHRKNSRLVRHCIADCTVVPWVCTAAASEALELCIAVNCTTRCTQHLRVEAAM
jgi:hypothetical protein